MKVDDLQEGTVPAQTIQEHGSAPPCFVALSKFVVANGLEAEVKTAFKQRPHLVDGTPGFIRMDVLSPRDCSEEIWLLTYWRDGESYRAWHHSHRYRESHRGIPRGLKLVPGKTQIRELEYVSN